jgi:hypothetical protein
MNLLYLAEPMLVFRCISMRMAVVSRGKIVWKSNTVYSNGIHTLQQWEVWFRGRSLQVDSTVVGGECGGQWTDGIG